MDVESPEHLEHLRDLPEIKAALLRLSSLWPAKEVRFERSARNTSYWPPLEALAAEFIAAGAPRDVCTTLTVYGRPCWLICTMLGPAPDAPYAVAVVAADGVDKETIVAKLHKATHDYWYGSYFFK